MLNLMDNNYGQRDFLTSRHSARSCRFFTKGVGASRSGSQLMIWTRVTDLQSRVWGWWQVAWDKEFDFIVAEGDFTTNMDADHQVVVGVPIPDEAARYYYRFRTCGYWSAMGASDSGDR